MGLSPPNNQLSLLGHLLSVCSMLLQPMVVESNCIIIFKKECISVKIGYACLFSYTYNINIYIKCCENYNYCTHYFCILYTVFSQYNIHYTSIIVMIFNFPCWQVMIFYIVPLSYNITPPQSLAPGYSTLTKAPSLHLPIQLFPRIFRYSFAWHFWCSVPMAILEFPLRSFSCLFRMSSIFLGVDSRIH